MLKVKKQKKNHGNLKTALIFVCRKALEKCMKNWNTVYAQSKSRQYYGSGFQCKHV